VQEVPKLRNIMTIQAMLAPVDRTRKTKPMIAEQVLSSCYMLFAMRSLTSTEHSTM
jgi:hypothetical protein